MNIIDVPVYQLAEMLKDRKLSSAELTKAYLDRIKQVEGTVRAFITLMEEKAASMALAADGRLMSGTNTTPLTGIPIAIKDLLCIQGHPTTCGSKILQNFIPPYDASVIARLQDAGSVFLGKTNMDEFAMGSSTENSRFFCTRNPWNPAMVPGGSSGGSAAAVAARETPLALGTDTGGSIRQPAAFCGITGLKPTYGSVSRYGLVAYASSLDQIGPMARCVRDAALLLDAISFHDPLDSTSADVTRPRCYEASLRPGISGVKIGVPREFFREGMDEGIRQRLDEARRVMEGLGARFIDVSIPALDCSLAAYYVIAPCEASSNLARYDGCRYGYRAEGEPDVISMYKKTRREGFGEEVLRRIIIGTYALSSGYYEAYYLKAQKVRTLIKRDFDRAFQECDFLFAPATPTPAFPIGEKADDPLSMYLSDIFTVSVNMAGLPGLVVPCGFTKGLPVGLQLIGRAFGEASLVNAGAAFQEATDFHLKTPDCSVVSGQ